MKNDFLTTQYRAYSVACYSTHFLTLNAIGQMYSLQRMILTASGRFKFELLVNKKTIFTVFTTDSNPNVEVNLGILIDPVDEVQCHITNNDRSPCDAYVSVIASDMWAEYERNFTHQLEEELAKR